MAKISNIPKVGEFILLRSDNTEIDLQVTNITANHTLDGHSKIVVEGFPHRERSGMEYTGGSYPSNGIGNYVSWNGHITTAGAMSGYSIGAYTSDPGAQKQTVKFNIKRQGMNVDINTIETVDGTKAQIVLYAGTKKVIAWESEAFEDDEDLSAKGAQTADVKAKKAAEGHAKSVLKAVFSQT